MVASLIVDLDLVRMDGWREGLEWDGMDLGTGLGRSFCVEVELRVEVVEGRFVNVNGKCMVCEGREWNVEWDLNRDSF